MLHYTSVCWKVYNLSTCEPGSKLLVLEMVIQPLIGNPYNGYINPYYWVDDHPLLYGNNGSLDPGTFGEEFPMFLFHGKNPAVKQKLSFLEVVFLQNKW